MKYYTRFLTSDSCKQLRKYFNTQYMISGCKHFSPGDVTGQFTAPPPTCPGDTFTFRCTVGDVNGETTWRVGGNSQCPLSHQRRSTAVCGPNREFQATPGIGFGMTSATSFTSTLSGTAVFTLNSTLVECFGPANNVLPENRVDSSTLQIIGWCKSLQPKMLAESRV